MTSFFQRSIEFLKSVGPQRGDLLKKELGIFTYGDLIEHYPFRYEDRTKFYKINEIREELPYIQLVGKFVSFQTVGVGHKQRLAGQFADETGVVELVWFQGAKWVMGRLTVGVEYVVFGKPARFGSKYNIVHPEVDLL
ncbi:MAG: ATP-dependent DNA helicase RecG, partial [Flavobacteriaceae bacterium]